MCLQMFFVSLDSEINQRDPEHLNGVEKGDKRSCL